MMHTLKCLKTTCENVDKTQQAYTHTEYVVLGRAAQLLCHQWGSIKKGKNDNNKAK